MRKNNHTPAAVLFIHNTYLHQGGEDSVVQNEIETLRKEGHPVFYHAYNNQSFQQNKWKAPLLLLRLFFNVSAWLRTYFFVRRHRIAVVHVHNFFYTASPAVFWAAKAAGAKTVMTMHNYRLFCLNALFFREGKHCMICVQEGRFKQGIEHRCFKSSTLFSWALAGSINFHKWLGTWHHRVDRFIVINPLMQQLLSGMNIPTNKVLFKPNFLPGQAYHDYQHRSDFYLYAGRLQEEKGIRHVIEAFEHLGLPLVIAGQGDLETYVREHAKESIRYVGQQSQQDMMQWFRQCRGFIFSSLLMEGMPMTVIEAQACGAIPIVSRTINTEGMIDQGLDGFLYEQGNAASLITAILQLEAQDQNTLNAISGRARQKFLRYYDASHHLRMIKELYGFTD